MDLSNYRSIEAFMDSDIPEPILRIDFFLHAVITGTECELEPTTHAEELLYSLATGDESRLEFVEPRTILDTYLHALQNGDTSDLPKPRTVSEMLLYQAVTGEDLGIKPVSRMDKYLSVLQKAGGLDYILSTSDDVSVIPLPNSTSGTAMIGEICGNHAIINKETLSFVGTSKNNTIGIKVTGKNLFDKSKVKFVQKNLNESSGIIVNTFNGNYTFEEFLPVDFSGTVLFDSNNPVVTYSKVAFYDENKTFISCLMNSSGQSVFGSVPKNAKYYRLGAYYSTQAPTCDVFMLTRYTGTNKALYEEYVAPYNATLTLPNELRSVSDDRYDRIIYKENDGTYFEQNIRKLTLNGGENWTAYSLNNNFPDVIGFYCQPGNIDYDSKNSKANCVISSDINTISQDVFPGGLTRNEEILCLGHNASGESVGNHHVKMSIRRDKLSALNVSSFKAYLKENPITIYFKSHTPTITKISDMEFKCSDNVTLDLDYGSVSPTKVVIRYPYKKPVARFRKL